MINVLEYLMLRHAFKLSMSAAGNAGGHKIVNKF